MAGTPNDPHLGDTLGPSRAGRVDRAIGETQGGSESHERASFSDPITQSESDQGASADRVPGAASTTPDYPEPRNPDFVDTGDVDDTREAATRMNTHDAPMRGAGVPVRPVVDWVGESPDASGITSERDMHRAHPPMAKQAQSSPGGQMDRNERERLDAVDASGKGPKTNDIIHHDDHPDVGDHIGEAAGGISGVLAGAAIGSAGGPIGTIIGGIAGAIGGWWSGRAISEAATRFTHSDDDFYRNHYETSPNRLADRKYEDVRPAYQLGHLAGHNPDYANREWDEVERDLQSGWSDDLRARHGDWQSVRGYARDAYTRGRSSYAAGGAGAATSAAGTTGSTGSLGDRAANTADRVGDKAENLWDRTKQGAEHLGHRIADKADDVKDRVDGDPSTRPGPDRTDDRDRSF